MFPSMFVRLAVSAVLAAFGLIPLAASAAEKRPVALDDFQALRKVADPQISPDGAWVAYTVRAIDIKRDKQTTDVWMTSWDGTRAIQLTSSPGNEHHARWSPDGQYLAFLSSRTSDEDGEQVWLMNRAGGEATKITEIKGGVSDFAGSPDGKRLALVVQDPDPDAAESEKQGAEKKAPRPIVIDRYYFKEDKSGYLDRKRHHLFLFDLATRKAECLTPGNYHESLPAWSPDGSSIAFVSKRGADFDRHLNHDIYVIEARLGATPRQLTTFEGADCDPDWESRPAWSPDGRSIAYVQGGESKLIFYATHQLAVIPSAGGAARLVAPALDRNMVQPRWASDGKSIYCIIEDDGNRHLAKVALAGGKVERALAGRRNTTGFDLARDGKIAILDSTPHQPPEVYALQPGARPLSRQNDKLLEQLKLAAVDEIRFQSADGTEIHGFAVNPLDYQAGKKYPTILRIHGGPVSQFSNEFYFDWQLYAAQGYLVVAANPRGSSGRGEAFAKAIYADWGNLDRQDVLAAVDHVVAQGLADPARLGVGGWSYGAMLTNYVIASDTRFKAAVSGAGSSNILASYGTDMYIREYEAELGTPWGNPDAWMRVSYPFLHADRIVTPTLFVCGEKDFNVPLLNSEQMYQALSSLGRDTQLIIYPGQFHEITRPSYQRDRAQRYLDWYGKYVGESASAAASR